MVVAVKVSAGVNFGEIKVMSIELIKSRHNFSINSLLKQGKLKCRT